MVINSGVKPFACRICDKKFTKKSVVKTHFEQAHLQLKKHEWKLCGKRLKHGAGLLNALFIILLKLYVELWIWTS